MLLKPVRFARKELVVICDGKCNKAFGINARPEIQLSEEVDDKAYLADSEVGEAPAISHVWEGGENKPQSPDERLNKWCIRECERSRLIEPNTEFRLSLKTFAKLIGKNVSICMSDDKAQKYTP